MWYCCDGSVHTGDLQPKVLDRASARYDEEHAALYWFHTLVSMHCLRSHASAYACARELQI